MKYFVICSTFCTIRTRMLIQNLREYVKKGGNMRRLHKSVIVINGFMVVFA